MMKKAIRLAMALLILLAAAGCAKGTSEAPELLEPVRGKQDTGTVMRGDFQKTEAFYGVLTPRVTQVYMKGSGTIEEIICWNGRKVKKGEVLIELDREAVEKEIESTEEALTELQTLADFDNGIMDLQIAGKNRELNHLYGTGAPYRATASKKLEVDELLLQKEQTAEKRELQKKALEEKLSGLRTDLTNLVIEAPCSGYVYLDESLTNGMYVMEGKPILRILDDSDLVLRTDSYVSETLLNGEYYGWIDGGRCELEYLPMDRSEFLALIAAGEPMYSEFRVIDGESYEAGDSCAVIAVTRKVTDVLYVPVNALSTDGGGYYLSIETENGTEKRYVSTGASNGLVSEIRSGVSEGEVFYVTK